MKYLLLIFLFVISQNAHCQNVDSIRVGDLFKAYDSFNFASFDFEVFTIRNGEKTVPIKMSSMQEFREIDGKSYLNITHKWINSQMTGGFSALVEAKTFKPVIQIRESKKGKEAYHFYEDKITGLDSATNNLAANYEQLLNEAVFNFEIDLETYALLPFEDGKTIFLPFHHAGSQYTQPGWYKYTISLEQLEIKNQGKVATWVIYTDYKGTQKTKFWYTKEGREFVKMEADFKGMKVCKVRIF